MSGSAKPPGWGSELPDAPPEIVRPIATVSGFDLSRDMDEQVLTRSGADDPVLREPLTTPYRRWHAVQYGAGAAGMLAALNVMSMMEVQRRPLHHVLVGPDAESYLAAHAAVAALAVSLALIILSRGYLWACQAVVAWAVTELAAPVFHWLYGHTLIGRMWLVAFMALVFALIGLQGARAERRAAAKPGGLSPSPAPPAARP